MPLHYSISAILDQLEKSSEDGRARFRVMMPVTDKRPADSDFTDDIFILSSTPKLLDAENEQSVHDLAMLLDEAPLYHINMQLVLDEALTERYNNAVIERALEQAFKPEPLPNTLTSGEQHEDEPAGSLRHPMVEHLDTLTLCRFYTRFLRFLPAGYQDYQFERAILGKHGARFADSFDGFLAGGKGKIKAEILVGFGKRRDHDSTRAADSYAEAGRRRARLMSIGEKRELLWAWLECDHYQMRRCLDIHRLLSLGGLPRMPNWVRLDVQLFIEREAMKQYFAARILESDPTLSFLGAAEHLKTALRNNALENHDPHLQDLIAQVRESGDHYQGAAGQLAEAAALRAREAQMEKLI